MRVPQNPAILEPRSATKRVLLVDDDPIDRDLARVVLERELPDLEIVEISDPVGFGEALVRGGFDIVLTEYRLGYTDGLAILGTVKSRYPNCPVVMFTTDSCEEVAVKAVRLGLDDYVLKSRREFLRLPNTVSQAMERAELRRQASEWGTPIQSLLERSHIGTVRATVDGVVLDASRPLLTLMGINTLQQARTLNLFSLFKFPEPPQTAAARARTEGFSHFPRLQLKRPDGALAWVSLSLLLVKMPEHDAVLYGLVEEITEHQRVEEELTLRATDLARLNARLEEFAYVASHELAEPLRMVSRYSQMLAERYAQQTEPGARQFVSYIIDGATRMQRLVDDLLTYARVDTRGKPFEPTDLQKIVNEVLRRRKEAIEAGKAKVTRGPLPTLMADGDQMMQLFDNLISNAIKFHKPGEAPQVSIEADETPEGWVVSVRDNGIGIESKDADKIFGVFQRLHAPDEYSGTGIGLALCKKIVERHGGRIWVESTPGVGSTFYCLLPPTPPPG